MYVNINCYGFTIWTSNGEWMMCWLILMSVVDQLLCHCFALEPSILCPNNEIKVVIIFSNGNCCGNPVHICSYWDPLFVVVLLSILLTCDGTFFALHRLLRSVWMLWNLMLLISWCTPKILKKNMIKQNHGLRQNTVYVVSCFNTSWELFVL
jgi:hypothetical protein